ncbi:MAG: colanic acid biosynthesis glycosyltransferase WcaL [Planctomycetes bacterium]|nr:colanic acid biosynthesis glycosyltransferase WcaL [Planctomycetota bacterium]
MKIAILVPDFPRRHQPYVLGQLEGLLERGHELAIFAPPTPAGAVDDAARERLASHWRPQPPLATARLPRTLSGLALAARHAWCHPRIVGRALNPLRFGRYALSFAALHAAVPLLDRPRFDAVHCHFGPAGVTGAMLHELGVLRGPLVATFYGHDVTRYPQERGGDVYRRLFDRAALVLALDPVMRDRLEALGAKPEQLDVHPLAVDCRRFTPTGHAPPRPPLRLLSVGRLVEKKGFADGLRAVALARARGLPVAYHIAGDGPLDRELRALADELGIADAVHFAGAVGHEDVPALMAGAHALIAPSVRASDGDEEGTPTVILEAMASGLPVVATRHAGIPHQVDEGVTGWLVDEHDVEAMAERIARLEDADLAGRLGSAGRAAALERFDTERLADVLVARYEGLAGGSGALPGL